MHNNLNETFVASLECELTEVSAILWHLSLITTEDRYTYARLLFSHIATPEEWQKNELKGL